MKKLLGILLVVLGVLALVYKGFSYQATRRAAQIGPLELELKKTERVEVPVWAGVVLVGAGAGLLLLRR
jgi:uncharacterized membrane protein